MQRFATLERLVVVLSNGDRQETRQVKLVRNIQGIPSRRSSLVGREDDTVSVVPEIFFKGGHGTQKVAIIIR